MEYDTFSNVEKDMFYIGLISIHTVFSNSVYIDIIVAKHGIWYFFNVETDVFNIARALVNLIYQVVG